MKIKTTTMEVQTVKRFYTPEEYLELEAKAEYKSEYRDGEIIPMTGGTTNHNQIAGNYYELRIANCELRIANCFNLPGDALPIKA
jgi:Uma2 family endonuclease